MNKAEKGAIIVFVLLLFSIGFKFYAESLIPGPSEIQTGQTYQDYTTLANYILFLIILVVIIGSIIAFFVLLKKAIEAKAIHGAFDRIIIGLLFFFTGVVGAVIFLWLRLKKTEKQIKDFQ